MANETVAQARNSVRESGRFRKPVAVAGDQGDDASNLEECRNKLELTCDALVVACDQLGEAIATAESCQDRDALDQLLPVLLTLWRLRWDLFISPGEVSAEPSVRRQVACYPEAEESEAAERDLDVLKQAAAQRNGGAS